VGRNRRAAGRSAPFMKRSIAASRCSIRRRCTGFGHSEEILGKALAQDGATQSAAAIATKVGLEPGRDRSKPFRQRQQAADHEEVEDFTCGVLRTDVIDLYQVALARSPARRLPRPPPPWPISFAPGKIPRHMGVSNFSPAQMGRVSRRRTAACRAAAIQPVRARRSKRMFCPIAANMASLCSLYGSLSRGLLSGKMSCRAPALTGTICARPIRNSSRRGFCGVSRGPSARTPRFAFAQDNYGKRVNRSSVRWVA